MHQRVADHFIDSIMAADVLTENDERGRIVTSSKQRGGVQTPGRSEDVLSLAHDRRQAQNRFIGDAKAAAQGLESALERLDAGLAADAATRRDSEIALQALAQPGRGNAQYDVEDVGLGAAVGGADAAHLVDLAARGDKALGEKKTGDEFFVVA